MHTKSPHHRLLRILQALLLACLFQSFVYAQPADGLIFHWAMDESTGLTAEDSSGNGHFGILEGYLGDDTQWVEGQVEGALNLDGTQHVAVAGLPTLSSTTWATWVRPTATPNFSGIISATFPNVGAGAGHSLGFHTGATVFHPRIVWNHNLTPTILIAPSPVPVNEWSHVALTYDADSTTLVLYVNGELAASSETATSTAFTSINIGRREATALNPLVGQLDEVLVYDRALSLEEVQELAGRIVAGPPVFTLEPISHSVYVGATVEFVARAEGAEPISYQWYRGDTLLQDETADRLILTDVEMDDADTYRVVATNDVDEEEASASLTVSPIDLALGLQAHWTFDETSGLFAVDSGASANAGALVNFLDDTSHWIPGQMGGALRFNGQNYVEVQDHPSIGAELTQGFTVATWFRSRVPLPATGGTRVSRIMEKGDAFFFLQNPGTGGMNFLVKNNNANYTASTFASMEAERWYHIAGTFDGHQMHVYLDGEWRSSVTVGGPMDDDFLPLRIGSDDASSFFNGDMDDVRIWNRALNGREIMNVMGRNLPNPPSFVEQPKDTTAYPGSTVRLTVDVRGQEPFRFLWYKGDEEIRSATTATLLLEDATAADAGEYRVEVTNDLGDDFSETATVTILPIENVTTGMVGFWKFDEAAGLVAADSSNNDREGQLVDFFDGAQWVEGRVGNALAFDGFANRVVVQNSESVELPQDVTIAFWIRPESYGTEQSAGTYNFHEGRILRKGSHMDALVVDNPGGVRRTLIVNGVNAPQNSVDLGVWQHFAAVFKNGRVQYYKDGFPLGDSVAASVGGGNATPLVLGGFDAEGLTPRYFHGAMDEVGIWIRPLSESEILEVAGKDVSGPPFIERDLESLTRLEGGTAMFQVVASGKRPVDYEWYHNGELIPEADSSRLILLDLAPSDSGEYFVRVINEFDSVDSSIVDLEVEPLDSISSGLIAHWTFDEESGSTASDSSGRGNHGDLINFTAVPGVAGQVGGAFDFDGVDDFIVVPHDDSLNLTDQGTIAAWINPRTYSVVGGHGRILRKSVNYDLTVVDEGGGTLRFFGLNKLAYNSPPASVELNRVCDGIVTTGGFRRLRGSEIGWNY